MKAIKFGGIVITFIGDILDPIIAGIEFVEKNDTFFRKYFHEHPKTDKINCEFKLPFSLKKNTSEFTDDDEINFEFIVKKQTAI